MAAARSMLQRIQLDVYPRGQVSTLSIPPGN